MSMSMAVWQFLVAVYITVLAVVCTSLYISKQFLLYSLSLQISPSHLAKELTRKRQQYKNKIGVHYWNAHIPREEKEMFCCAERVMDTWEVTLSSMLVVSQTPTWPWSKRGVSRIWIQMFLHKLFSFNPSTFLRHCQDPQEHTSAGVCQYNPVI